MTTWTDDRVERLKILWLQGRSASAVARQLGGVTRNAVIGKMHRLGLFGRASASAPGRLTTARPPRPSRAADAPLRLVMLAPPPPPPPPALAPCSPGVPLLRSSACGRRFAIGDPRSENFGFCDAPRSRGSYCAQHAAVVFQPLTPTRAKAVPPGTARST